MSEQVQPTNPNPEPAKETPTAAMPEKTGGKTYTETELETILKERLTRAQLQAEKKIKEAQEQAALETAKKNQDWEALAKANEAKYLETEAKLKARELADLKKSIAEKVGLPVALAARLQGETDAELEADAKTLLETLPKTPKPNPGPVPNPMGGTPVNPEVAIRNLLDGNNTAWDKNNIEERGGGVIFGG